MATCVHCNGSIDVENPFSAPHKVISCDGDFIHTACEAAYRSKQNAFFAPGGPGSSNEALAAWLRS